MLYDILPPLFLLASIGGMISLLSRVVIRVQRDRLSAEIKAHALSARPVEAEELLRKSGSRLQLLTDRLSNVRKGVAGAGSRLKGLGSASKGKLAGGFTAASQGIRGKLESRRLRRDQVEDVQEDLQSETPAPQVQQSEKPATPGRVVEPPQRRPLLRRVVERQEVPEKAEKQSMTVGKLLRKKPVAERPKSPLDQASVCLKERKFKKAEDILLPYIVQHTRDVNAYMLLGRSAIGRGQWDEALEIYRQVRSIDDSVPGLNAALGTAALKAGKMTMAVEALQKARDEEPHNISVRKLLLNIAQRMDNKVLERSVLEELSELNQEKAAAKAQG